MGSLRKGRKASSVSHVADMTASLPRLPRLADRLNVIPLDGSRLRLQSLTESMTITEEENGLFHRLIPLLTGENDLASLLDQLPEFGRSPVADALQRLAERGVLEDAAEGCPSWLSRCELDRYRSQVIYFSHFPCMTDDLDGATHGDSGRFRFQERLRNAKVVVFGLGRLGSNLIRSLAQVGVGELLGVDAACVTQDDVYAGGWFHETDIGQPRVGVLMKQLNLDNSLTGFTGVGNLDELGQLVADASLAVIVTDDYDPSFYEALNQECLRQKVAWTSGRLLGFELAMGPSVIPFETPCFACFTGRLKANTPSIEDYSSLETFLSRERWSSGHLNVVIGADLVALEVVKILTYFAPPRTWAHLFTLDLITLKSRLDPILKLPFCPDCGLPSQARPPMVIWDEG